tara:strand:- start:100 stop:300 length:201 start_codon:yes stop_codon:yes gene_type:complete
MNKFFAEKILIILENMDGQFTANQVRDRVINQFGHMHYIENTTSVGAFLGRYCVNLGNRMWTKKEE